MTGRKRIPRVKVSCSAVYFGDHYPSPFVAKTVNLGLEGTRIETPYRLSPGEKVKIIIAIQPQTVECRGKVADVQVSSYGNTTAEVRFEEMSKADRLILREFLSQITQRPEQC